MNLKGNLLKLVFILLTGSLAYSHPAQQPDPTKLLEDLMAGSYPVNSTDLTPPSADPITNLRPSRPNISPVFTIPAWSYFLQDFNEPLPEFTPITSNDSIENPVTRRLYREIIAFPVRPRDSDEKQRLLNLLEQIRSIEFLQPQMFLQNPAILPQAQQPVAQAPIKPQQQPQVEPKHSPVEPNNLTGPNSLSEETLKKIAVLCENPAQVKNPFELAEILFLSGYPKQAAVFYQEKLNRIGENLDLSAADKAWIIFQTANCLRQESPAKAAELYKKLITEFPDCPWTDLARTRVSLLEWLQREKPEQLVNIQKQ